MAAVAGADGYFLETHNDPDNAPSDGPNMIPVEHLGRLLKQLSQIHEWRDSIEKLPFESV
jgi:2-dehydro-3-deoxyphosphooctonate aldolase (KDO 8-P synthase)